MDIGFSMSRFVATRRYILLFSSLSKMSRHLPYDLLFSTVYYLVNSPINTHRNRNRLYLGIFTHEGWDSWTNPELDEDVYIRVCFLNTQTSLSLENKSHIKNTFFFSLKNVAASSIRPSFFHCLLSYDFRTFQLSGVS